MGGMVGWGPISRSDRNDACWTICVRSVVHVTYMLQHVAHGIVVPLDSWYPISPGFVACVIPEPVYIRVAASAFSRSDVIRRYDLLPCDTVTNCDPVVDRFDLDLDLPGCLCRSCSLHLSIFPGLDHMGASLAGHECHFNWQSWNSLPTDAIESAQRESVATAQLSQLCNCCIMLMASWPNGSRAQVRQQVRHERSLEQAERMRGVEVPRHSSMDCRQTMYLGVFRYLDIWTMCPCVPQVSWGTADLSGNMCSHHGNGLSAFRLSMSTRRTRTVWQYTMLECPGPKKGAR